MKVARIAVLGVAVVAGFLAWRLASSIGSGDDSPVVVEKNVETEQVLVARKDIAPGAKISEADMSWEAWPRDSISDALSLLHISDPTRPS